MTVKCKCCGKRISKEEAIKVPEKWMDIDGYFCFCSEECLNKSKE